MEWIWENWQDVLALTEDWMKSSAYIEDMEAIKMYFNNGDRVQVKNVPSQPWFEQDKKYVGSVVGQEDGNIVVRLDEPIQCGGKLLADFSFQPTSLQPRDLLAAITTSLNPDSYAYIRILFPDAIGVQVLPSYGVQDYDEAVEIVKAAHPTAQIVTAHELSQEVERRQPNIMVSEEYFEAEF